MSSSNDDITLSQVSDIAKKIAPFNWVLQLQDKNPNLITDYGNPLSELPCPIIFDHFGRTGPKGSTSTANFYELLRLLKNRKYMGKAFRAISKFCFWSSTL